MSDNNELKIQIPVLVDDSAAAKGRFQKSIAQLAKNMKGANAPKIEITVSKINGASAIKAFKKEIEAAIGAIGKTEVKPKITMDSKAWKAPYAQKQEISSPPYNIKPYKDLLKLKEIEHNQQLQREEDALAASNKKKEQEAARHQSALKKAADTAKIKSDTQTMTSAVSNIETDIAKFKTMGRDVSEVEKNFIDLTSAKKDFDAVLSNKNADVTKITDAYEKYNHALVTTNNSLSQVRHQSAATTSIDKNKAALRNLILEIQAYKKANDNLYKNSRFSSEFTSLEKELQAALSSGNVSGVNAFIDKFKDLKFRISDAGDEGQRFGTKLGQQFEKLGVYLSASAVIMKLGQAINATVTTMLELDSVVADLQIATGGTRKETQELLKTYSSMGKELGATTVDVGKAADAWLRQGYSVAQTNELIKNSMMLSKLGQIDSAEATKALTSAMKGYQISVEGSAGVVDKFTAVDMSAAVSAGYLATAMAETATSARLAGVDVNTLIGYIASIGEVTQDGAESVGNFMKTLFARMGNVKSGNLIDPETAENLGDVEATLSGLGVKLRTSKGEFRNFGEVLNEVAGDWSSYGSVQQRALAVAFSGTRQSEKFLTLMENFGTATDYATIATNSAGTALDKYENSYLKSAEAAQAAFTAQFEQMSNTIWNSNFFIGAIDAGTGALGFFTQMVDTIGAIPPLLATVMGAISAFKEKGIFIPKGAAGNLSGKNITNIFSESKIANADAEVFERINAEIKKGIAPGKALGKEWLNLSKTNQELARSVERSGGSFEALTKSAQSMTVASKATALGMKAMSVAANAALSFGIGIAINWAVGLISNLISAQQEAIDKANELTSAYKSTSNEIQSNIKDIESLREEFNSLAKGVDGAGKNISLSADEYTRYHSIIEKLVEMNPSLIKGYADEGQVLVEKNTIIEDSIRLQKELNDEKRKEYLLSGEDVVSGARKEAQKAANKLDDEIPIWEDSSTSGRILANQMKGVRNRIGSLAELDEMNSVISQFGLDFEKIQVGNVEELRKIIPLQNQMIKALADHYDLSEVKQEDLLRTIGLIDLELNKIDAENTKISSLLSSWASDPSNTSWYGEIDTGFLDEFQKSIDEIAKDPLMNWSEMQVATKQLGKSFSAMQDEIPINEFTQLTEKYAKGFIEASEYNASVKSLTDILSALKEKYPELSIALDDLSNQWKDFKRDVESEPATPGIDNIIEGVAKAEDKFSTLRTVLSESLSPDEAVSNSSLSSLKEHFGKLGDIYEDSIAVISNSKSTYAEVKTAVESLASAYMSSTEFIKQVNEGNKEALVLSLQNIGITNAEEIALRALATAKIEDAIATELSTYQTGELSESTQQLIFDLYGLSAGTEEAAKKIALFELKKQIISNGNLSKYLLEDSKGFLALATAAGIAGTAMGKYASISARIKDLRYNGDHGDEYAAQLSVLQKELSSIQSELETEINAALSAPYSFKIDLKPKTTNSTKVVEEYLSEIDKLYKAEEELSRIQRDRAAVEAKLNLTDGYDEKIRYLKQIAVYYENEQKKLHEINNLRDDMMRDGVKILQGQGFQVEYDAGSNNFLVKNMEQLHKLRANGPGIYKTEQEATNALRKETEDYIKTLISLNKESEEASNQHLVLGSSIRSSNEEIKAIEHQKYTDQIEVITNRTSLLESQYSTFNENEDSDKAIENLEKQAAEAKLIQEKSAAEAARLRKAGVDENNADLQACVKAWWDAQQKIAGIQEDIQSIEHRKYTIEIEASGNRTSLLENQYVVSEGKLDSSDAIRNLNAQAAEAKLIQEKSAAEAARLREAGVDENNAELQACIKAWWDAQRQLEDINSSIANSLIASYDEFITRADSFDWWDDIETSKVEWLEKKLKTINEQFALGNITEKEHKELVEETAKSIYDIKNQAIQDTIDLTMELIKQEKQNEIDVLEGQKKTYADIVDAKKEALALTKEEYGYQKTLTDKLAEIAKIQNKLNELAPDDSRESIAEQKKLKEELAKLQGDLDDTQAEHTYESQVDALDKSQEAFEKSKDEEIKLIKESIDTTQELYDEAIKRIDAGWDELYSDLIWYNTNYGDGINGQDSIKSAWEEAKKAAEEYGDIARANAGIKTEHAPNSGGNGSVGDSLKNSPQVQNIVSQMRARKDQWHTQLTQSEKEKMENDSLADAQKLRDLGINAIRGHDGVWYVDRVGGKKLFEEYHTGGEVGATKFKSNERLALLEDKELVVDSGKTGGLYKLLDWAAFAKEKLGASFSGSFDSSLFSASPQNMLASVKGAPIPNSSFSPTIEVNINGPISKDLDPKKFGKLAGESALEVLKTALGGGQSGTSKSPIFST